MKIWIIVIFSKNNTFLIKNLRLKNNKSIFCLIVCLQLETQLFLMKKEGLITTIERILVKYTRVYIESIPGSKPNKKQYFFIVFGEKDKYSVYFSLCF